MKWFRRAASDTQASQAQTQPDFATEDDVRLAYRLVLKRDPDASGLEHYRMRLASGLSLDDLVRELLTSDERANRLVSTGTSAGTGAVSDGVRAGDERNSASPTESLINPEDVISRLSLDALNDTADTYYARIDDPTPLMLKPFAFLQETPEMLENLGVVLGGLQLGKTMRVLDFGAGTCWLSRILSQLHCEVICCDVSAAALEIGRRLYREQPPIGAGVVAPEFLVFDGRRIDLPDASVDRVICFDAFHHVPNQAEVVAELARVLKPGGIAGFSEPGRYHSRAPQAQYEMRHHRVLENDIRLDDIARHATAAGFSDVTVRVLADAMVPLETYEAIVSDRADPRVKDDVWRNTRDTMTNRTLFFLHKGPTRRDSRTHIGLAHHMETSTPSVIADEGGMARVAVTIANTGTALWLHRNSQIYGTVRLASRLHDAAGTLLEVDHSRHNLPRDVAPGESIAMVVDVPVPEAARVRLDFDLVSEGVRWFENEGSRPVSVVVTRR